MKSGLIVETLCSSSFQDTERRQDQEGILCLLQQIQIKQLLFRFAIYNVHAF